MFIGAIAANRRRGGGGVGGGLTDDYFDKVVLLMGMDGADGSTTFIDESDNPVTFTASGAAALEDSEKRFGTASLKLAASSSISTPGPAKWDFSTATDWTVELWFRFDSDSGAAVQLIGYFLFSITMQTGGYQFFMRDGTNTSRNLTVASTRPVGTWTHAVFERSGSDLRGYVNGTMVAKSAGTPSGMIGPGSNSLHIGEHACYIDEVRITKGLARYNSDSGYTVPTSAFPRSGTPPVFTVNPAIISDSGFPGVGDTLTTTNGTHSGTSQTYQWKRDGAAISAATSSSYVLVSGDLGAMITCTVTATNYTGSTPATSNSLGPVVTPTYSADPRITPTSDTRVTPTGDTRITSVRTA